MWKRERERANYACNLYTENFNLTNIYLVLIMWQGLRFCGKVEESESVSCLVMSNSFGTPWTTAHQAPLSMEFSRQEYWSGLPSPGDLPNPGIEPRSSALQEDSLLSEPPGSWEIHTQMNGLCYKVLGFDE